MQTASPLRKTSMSLGLGAIGFVVVLLSCAPWFKGLQSVTGKGIFVAVAPLIVMLLAGTVGYYFPRLALIEPASTAGQQADGSSLAYAVLFATMFGLVSLSWVCNEALKDDEDEESITWANLTGLDGKRSNDVPVCLVRWFVRRRDNSGARAVVQKDADRHWQQLQYR